MLGKQWRKWIDIANIIIISNNLAQSNTYPNLWSLLTSLVEEQDDNTYYDFKNVL